MQLSALPTPPDPQTGAPLPPTGVNAPAKRPRDPGRGDDALDAASAAFSAIFNALAASAVVEPDAVLTVADSARQPAMVEIGRPAAHEMPSVSVASSVAEPELESGTPVDAGVTKIRGRCTLLNHFRGKLRQDDRTTDVSVETLVPPPSVMLAETPAWAPASSSVSDLLSQTSMSEPAPGAIRIAAEIAGNDERVRNAPSAVLARVDLRSNQATGEDDGGQCDREAHVQPFVDSADAVSKHERPNDEPTSDAEVKIAGRALPKPSGEVHPESTDTAGRTVPRSERAEILSAHGNHSPDTSTEHEAGGDKKALSPRQEGLAEHVSFVGTTIAKPAAVMASPSNSRHELSAPTGDAGIFTGSAVEVAASSHVAASIESLAGGSQVAVETILLLADRLSSGDRQTVNLRFSIAGKDLRVRVGLWGNEVRTAFHTESRELRAALTSEWQALRCNETDQVRIRFADPIFSSADGETPSQSSSADTSSREHRESSRQEQFSATREFALVPSSRRASSETPPQAPTRGMPLRHSTQRLHAFA